MDAKDASELIEGGDDHAAENNRQKNRTALTISIFAMVLAITSLGGSNAAKDITQENILAANTYAFYQAKSIRQTTLKVAAVDMELQLLREPTMNAAAKEATQKKIDDYKKTVERYESEPDTKEGKKELMVRAKAHEAVRDHAIRQDPWFDYAKADCKLLSCCYRSLSSAPYRLCISPVWGWVFWALCLRSTVSFCFTAEKQ